jgi:hypothetical protein
MVTKLENPERAADKRADRTAFLYIVIFTFLSWIILSNSDYLENLRDGLRRPWFEPWLIQGTSHIAILIVIACIPGLLSRFPLSLENWKRRIPIYMAGFALFGATHIILMMLLRTLSFPILLGRDHEQSLLRLGLWIYELPKDGYTYLLVLSVFLTARHIEQLRLEAANAKQEARETGRLRLKSGGRILFLKADDILRAEAASNYVDIKTPSGQHFIRMTLTSLEKLIGAAGDTHIRVHRSHLIKRKIIREIAPQSDGRLSVTLENGESLPVGRKFKSHLKSQGLA